MFLENLRLLTADLSTTIYVFHLKFLKYLYSGVFFYNRAKYNENLAQKTLPISMPKSQPPPLWKDHMTFESKVHVTTPINHFITDSDLKRTQ